MAKANFIIQIENLDKLEEFQNYLVRLREVEDRIINIRDELSGSIQQLLELRRIKHGICKKKDA